MSGFFRPDPKPEKKIKEKYQGIKKTALKKKFVAKEDNENASVPELINELDGILSQYIRLLYADKDGIVKCFTCENKAYWEDIENGHFVPRKNLATKHNIQNCHPQCVTCNNFLNGNLKVYAIKLDEKYGAGTAYELTALGKTICKRPAFEYRELIETYTDCVAKLKANLINQ